MEKTKLKRFVFFFFLQFVGRSGADNDRYSDPALHSIGNSGVHGDDMLRAQVIQPREILKTAALCQRQSRASYALLQRHGWVKLTFTSVVSIFFSFFLSFLFFLFDQWWNWMCQGHRLYSIKKLALVKSIEAKYRWRTRLFSNQRMNLRTIPNDRQCCLSITRFLFLFVLCWSEGNYQKFYRPWTILLSCLIVSYEFYEWNFWGKLSEILSSLNDPP